MSEFTKELPSRPGFYLVKNTNFEMAAELVKHKDGAMFWHTTELDVVEYRNFMEETEYKRVRFS